MHMMKFTCTVRYLLVSNLHSAIDYQCGFEPCNEKGPPCHLYSARLTHGVSKGRAAAIIARTVGGGAACVLHQSHPLYSHYIHVYIDEVTTSLLIVMKLMVLPECSDQALVGVRW